MQQKRPGGLAKAAVSFRVGGLPQHSRGPTQMGTQAVPVSGRLPDLDAGR